MRLFAKIAGHTIVLSQFQALLTDISGNALNWSMEVGVETYGPFTDCFGGFFFDGTRTLILPSSNLYRRGGEKTFSMLINPTSSQTNTYFACETPGGGSVLFSFYYGAANAWGYFDQFANSYFSPLIPAVLGILVPHVLTTRWKSTGGSGLIVEVFYDGVKLASSITTSVGTPVGTERLRLGGYTGGANLHARIASFRMLDYAQTDAEILAEHANAVADCVIDAPCNCPDNDLVEPARGGATNANAGPDFGIDVDALTDVPLDWALCSGLRNLGNALGRRLRSVLGSLASDPNYGFDLRDMLNASVDVSRFSALRGQIVAEIEKDERVSAVSSVNFDYNQSTQQLALALSVETAVGPFDLIVPIGAAPTIGSSS